MLSNEQRYALAAKMLSIVERMAFAGEKPLPAPEDVEPQARRGEVLANKLDEALSQFAQEAFQRGPESLLPQDQSSSSATAETEEPA